MPFELMEPNGIEVRSTKPAKVIREPAGTGSFCVCWGENVPVPLAGSRIYLLLAVI